MSIWVVLTHCNDRTDHETTNNAGCYPDHLENGAVHGGQDHPQAPFPVYTLKANMPLGQKTIFILVESGIIRAYRIVERRLYFIII